MVTKRFTLSSDAGTIVFDASFSNELDAQYFEWVLSPEIYRYWHAFATSLHPSNTYVVLSNNSTELSISDCTVAYGKVLDHFKKNAFQVSMESAEGICPESTFVPKSSLKVRLERIFIAHILGVLLAVGQNKLFEKIFDACCDNIYSSIENLDKQYQAISEIILTATSPPYLMKSGNPQTIKQPTIMRYLRVLDDCFQKKLSKISSGVNFNKKDQTILRGDLIEGWRFYRTYLESIRLDSAVGEINKTIVKPNRSYSLYIFLNCTQLSNLLHVYPPIVEILSLDGVLDAFVLWNELQSEIGDQQQIVLQDLLPVKPFSYPYPLSPIGYQNIYNLVRPETIIMKGRHASRPEMKTLVPFVRLYELLSSSNGGGVLDTARARLLHDALNNEVVLNAMRSDLHDALGQSDIEKMLFKPIKPFGLTL